MPQATDEDRAQAIALWGDIGCEGPIKFLESKGWKLTEGWEWEVPGPVTLETMPDDVWFAMGFLIREWDFGGIAKPPEIVIDDSPLILEALRTVVITLDTGLSWMDRLRVLLGYEIKQTVTLVCEFPPGRCQSSCETFVEGLRWRKPPTMKAG